MYSNDNLILHLIALLKKHNIKKVVVSPGSRHFTLTRSLEADNFFELYSVVDERSAAFFAIGLIQESQEVVAITCTSGTAALNYGSAVAEAFYQKLPLLVLTSDRIPENLNQFEDQMIKQYGIYDGFIKFQGQLKQINNITDEWYCNRIINEGLIKLRVNGNGPVHLNIPIENYTQDNFEVKDLPDVKVLSFRTAEEPEVFWKDISESLISKKIMIIWGQSVMINTDLLNNLNVFTQKYNTVILTDNISGLSHDKSIQNSFAVLRFIPDDKFNDFTPDIVIHVGGNVVFTYEIKAFLKKISSQYDYWLVGKEGEVSDPYYHLNNIFEMQEATFFDKLNKHNNDVKEKKSFFSIWKNLSESICEPDVRYSEMLAIGKLIKSLPKNSVLQIANSFSVRMANLFMIDSSIKCFCNRGVNGIDGCMSTAIGYAAASDKMVYLIIGDLAFFYDMNVLYNGHVGKNIRILLINNEGGGVLFSTLAKHKTIRNLASPNISKTAKLWAESNQFLYLSANDEITLDESIKLINQDDIDTPVLLEVFTKKEDDAQIFREYFTNKSSITFQNKVKGKIKSVLSKSGLFK